jgi:hypothetical protein
MIQSLIFPRSWCILKSLIVLYFKSWCIRIKSDWLVLYMMVDLFSQNRRLGKIVRITLNIMNLDVLVCIRYIVYRLITISHSLATILHSWLDSFVVCFSELILLVIMHMILFLEEYSRGLNTLIYSRIEKTLLFLIRQVVNLRLTAFFLFKMVFLCFSRFLNGADFMLNFKSFGFRCKNVWLLIFLQFSNHL